MLTFINIIVNTGHVNVMRKTIEEKYHFEKDSGIFSLYLILMNDKGTRGKILNFLCISMCIWFFPKVNILGYIHTAGRNAQFRSMAEIQFFLLIMCKCGLSPDCEVNTSHS